MTHYASYLISLFLINSAAIYGRYTEVKLSKNTFYAILLVINRCGFSVSEHLFVRLTKTRHTVHLLITLYSASNNTKCCQTGLWNIVAWLIQVNSNQLGQDA